MEYELKKCPFCGSDAYLKKYNESVQGIVDETAQVICTGCRCAMYLTWKELDELKKEYGFRGGYLHMHKELWKRLHDDTVNKWNRRA